MSLFSEINNLWGRKAEITDIFSSIQGEGIFVGARQIFIRFRRCNMECAYCDESRDAVPKEYSAMELLKEAHRLESEKGVHHSVSLTGGEPLVYWEFLKDFLRLLKKDNMKSYLETNGTLPEELSRVIDFVDIIAMDFKLPSSTGGREYWDEHLKFLKVAIQKKVFVKAVVTPSTTNEDILKSSELIRQIDPNLPFILQPATPVKGIGKIENNRLLEFIEAAGKKNLTSVRVIPQVHKTMGVK